MSRGRPVRRWYEARLPDGRLWAGSSDPEEILEASADLDAIAEYSGGRDVELSMIVTYQYEKREAWDGQLPADTDHVHDG